MEKILTDIIKFISIFKNCTPVMFGFILKLELQGRGWHQNQLFREMQLSTHSVVPVYQIKISLGEIEERVLFNNKMVSYACQSLQVAS